MGDNRPPAYMDGETAIYRASAIYGCPRSLGNWFIPDDEDNMPPKADKRYKGVNDAAASGNAFEQEAKGWIENHDGTISDDQQEIDIKIGSAKIRCHTDGRVRFEGDGLNALIRAFPHLNRHRGELHGGCLLECKEMNDKLYKQWLARGFEEFTGYAFQAMLYLRATGAPGVLYVVGCRKRGKELVPNKTLSVQFFPKDHPSLPKFAEVVKSVAAIEKARKGFRARLAAGDKPADVREDLLECNGKGFICPLKSQDLCTVDAKGKPIAKSITNHRPDLADLIRRERVAAMVAKKAAAVHKQLNDELKKAIMLNAKGDKLEIKPGNKLAVTTDNPDYRVSRFYVNKFKPSLLEADEPELYASPKYWILEPQVRVTAKGIEADDDALNELMEDDDDA